VDARECSRRISERARALGFDLCGVAPAADFEELARLPEWLAKGFAGEMRYLEDPRRQSPARVLEGARSLVVCALNYNTPLPYSAEVPINPGSIPRAVGAGLAPPNSAAGTNEKGGASPTPTGDDDAPRGWISRYAWGDDYHGILGAKLEELLGVMRAEIPGPFLARAYVDTGPVVERLAARYAGLGWLAKNTCLIHPELGSWLFLGVIVTTLELEPTLARHEAPPPDLCGNCTLCIDACPTGALVEPYLLDSRRCISYLTIEHRGEIPLELREPMGRHVFGCDICQDVCPWNRNAPVSPVAAFLPRESLFAPNLERLVSLTVEDYRTKFRASAIQRAKWRGLVRNACIALGNAAAGLVPIARARVAALLARLAKSEDSLIAEHARWALARFSEVPRS
jgi:epoxyqueuosine reductase